MAEETELPKFDTPASELGSSALFAPWVVVLCGGDEMSEPTLMYDGMTEDAAKQSAASGEPTMMAWMEAWPRERWEHEKARKAAFTARFQRGEGHLVMFSTPR